MAPVRKKYVIFSEEAMEVAVREVQNFMEKKAAAKIFNVPRSTIEGKRIGRDPYLSEN